MPFTQSLSNLKPETKSSGGPPLKELITKISELQVLLAEICSLIEQGVSFINSEEERLKSLKYTPKI